MPGGRQDGRRARRAAHPDAGRKTAARSSRCRSSSPAIRRPATATWACIGCRSTTRARPECTGSGTRAGRSTIASPNGAASGSGRRRPRRRSRPHLCGDRAAARRVDELLFAGFAAEARASSWCNARRSTSRCRRTRRSCWKATWTRPSGGAKGPSATTRATTRSPTISRSSTSPHHPRKEPDLPDDDRRQPADGGRLPRQGHRADLPAADPADAARDRRHESPDRGLLPQPGASSRSTSGTRAMPAR